VLQPGAANPKGVAAATSTTGTGPAVVGFHQAAAAAPSSPPASATEELHFWQEAVKAYKAGAESAGRKELLALAETKVEHFQKEAKACRPLGARYQAAQSKVDKEQKAVSSAELALDLLCDQLDAAVALKSAAELRLAEAHQDLQATRLELAVPVQAEVNTTNQMGMIAACLQAMISQGLIQATRDGPAFQQSMAEAMAGAVAAMQSPKAKVEPEEPGEDAKGDEEMDVEVTKEVKPETVPTASTGTAPPPPTVVPPTGGATEATQNTNSQGASQAKVSAAMEAAKAARAAKQEKEDRDRSRSPGGTRRA
jgi:hypothetical protein